MSFETERLGVSQTLNTILPDFFEDDQEKVILSQRHFLLCFSDTFRTFLASLSGNSESRDGVDSVSSSSFHKYKTTLPFQNTYLFARSLGNSCAFYMSGKCRSWKINFLHLTALEREVTNPNLQMNKVRWTAA